MPHQIPIWFALCTLTCLRFTMVIPQRRRACWCDVWWFSLHPMVIEYLPYIGTVRNERNNAHLAATQRA